MIDAEEDEPLLRKPYDRRRHPLWRTAAYFFFGVVTMMLLTLLFQPRTSPSRDWHRLHGETVPIAELERVLFESIDVERINQTLRHYTAGPHLGGQGFDLATYTKHVFEQEGIETRIDVYDIYLNRPKDHGLKMLDGSSVVYQASLEEDVVGEDPTTRIKDRVPAFHGYSASGNVTGQFVYVNYGRKQDYELLLAKGVSFKNKIVIARNQQIFRGLKIKFAQDLGAAGVLLYPDPRDDGLMTEANGYKPYPQGPARNPSSVKRGSVQFLSLGIGDPTTPGHASKGGVNRVDPHWITPKIPSLPISYAEIRPLLKHLNGKGPSAQELGQDDWEGSIPGVQYNAGPSEYEVNLYNLQEYGITPIWDVVGRVEGILKDQTVIIGNHRDAWVAGGAGDPNGGSAILVELARAFGALKKAGWKPFRTILLCSWDAEEFGLIGSTEWGEDSRSYLKKNALAYLNLDMAVIGSQFQAAASPLLMDLVKDAVSRVPAPEFSPHTDLLDLWRNQTGAEVSLLGSGSDYTVFQHHLGVPSVDFGFATGNKDPVYHYHSNYDSFHWMNKFGDPGLAKHVTIAKLWGLMTLTLSERYVVDFRAQNYARVLSDYVKTLDATGPMFEGLKSDLKSLFNVSTQFDAQALQLQQEYLTDLPWYKFPKKIALMARTHVVNLRLRQAERQFLCPEGLDGRSWFKHIASAPGRYTGYTPVILPGMTEALHDNDQQKFDKWVKITRNAVQALTKLLTI